MAEAPGMLQRRGSAFIGGNRYWKLIEEVFLDTAPQARQRAPELEDRREESYRWKTIPP
jgi:hypothetical protein